MLYITALGRRYEITLSLNMHDISLKVLQWWLEKRSCYLTYTFVDKRRSCIAERIRSTSPLLHKDSYQLSLQLGVRIRNYKRGSLQDDKLFRVESTEQQTL